MRTVQPITIAQLQTKVAQYAVACRDRDVALGAVFVAGMVFVVVGVSLRISGSPHRTGLGAMEAVGLAVIAVVFAYLIATTRRFHQTNAPRCPSCDRPLPKLRWMLPLLTLLKEFEEDLGAPPHMREQLREADVLRCSYCHAMIAAPAV
jgi:hypothetical protein